MGNSTNQADGNLVATIISLTQILPDINLPPTANAAPNQSILANDSVFLDGSACFDDNTE